MAIPPWTYSLLRRGIADVARKASETETVERLKKQASDLIQDLPEAAAKGIDAVLKKADLHKNHDENHLTRPAPFEGPIINASGTLFHSLGTGSSMTASAIDLGKELLASDLSSPMIHHASYEKRIQKLIPSDLQYSICITKNVSAAVTLLAMRNPKQVIAIDKDQSELEFQGDSFINQLARLAEVEVLDTNRPNLNDSFSDSITEMMVQVGSDTERRPRLVNSDASRILVADICTLSENAPHRIPTCWSLLRNGFDWVILPGNTILGGPDCGLIIGPQAEITALKSHYLWPSLEASPVTMLMLLMTIETGLNDPESVPTQALLGTSLDNIRSRTERLATRIGCNDQIIECKIEDCESSLTPNGTWTLPSQKLWLQHHSMTAEKWSRVLLETCPSILSDVQDEKLCIDLRWVHPSDDAKLGTVFGGELT